MIDREVRGTGCKRMGLVDVVAPIDGQDEQIVDARIAQNSRQGHPVAFRAVLDLESRKRGRQVADDDLVGGRVATVFVEGGHLDVEHAVVGEGMGLPRLPNR